MICLTCKNLSFEIICKDCQKNLLVPSFHKREIEDGFFNYSFYSLSELEDLINSKYNSLKATNIVKYAGKNLEFRQKNSRKFQINNLSDKFGILCDDLITTGTTIIQAKKALEKKNNQILFSLTLADAKL